MAKEKTDRYSVVEVPTQTAPMIRDNGDEKVYDVVTMLCRIANLLEEVAKNLGAK